MIIKGKSRSGPISLAAHLGNAEKNERVQLLEARGTVASDLRGALVEMDAYAAGSRCEKPLYHAAMSPEPPHRLTDEQRTEAVDALERKLGLEGHARVVVLHEKLGREHLHVVWSRMNMSTMRAVHDGHNYRKHEEVARDLEQRFGHDRVQGAHHERDGVERPDRTPSRAELRQEDRTGIKGRDVKAEVSAAFRSSDGPEAFKAALDDLGYILANGDRRDFVIVDRAGGVHSLARRIDTMKAADLAAFMQPIDRKNLPDVEAARALMAERNRQERDAREEKAYSRGGDYVSQARAAQAEHERRQAVLDKEANKDSVWDRIEVGETRRERELEKRTRSPGELTPDGDQTDEVRDSLDEDRERRSTQDNGDGAFAADSTDNEPSLGDVELTEAQQERLDRILAQHGPSRASSRDGPSRQNGAPGGGRTRSR